MSKEAVRQAYDNFLAVWLSDDAAGLGEVVADDVILAPPGEPLVRGKAAVQTWYENLLKQVTNKGVEANIDEIALDGGLGVVRGSFEWTVGPAGGGDDIIAVGSFVAGFRAQPDGAWKFAWEVWNTRSA